MAHDIMMLATGGLVGFLSALIITVYLMDRGMAVKLEYCAKHGTRLPWDDKLYRVELDSTRLSKE